MNRFIITRSLSLCIFAFSSLLFANTEQSYDWYDSFYKRLAEQEIKSIRYFQIWISPGKNNSDEALPIGGSWKNFDLWLETTTEFIESADAHLDIWSGDFIYELTVDKNVYQKHQALFDVMRLKYGSRFQISFIEDYLPSEGAAIGIAYQQCLCGVASVCSDYWRFAHAEIEKFDVNIYVDIDTLSQGLKNKKNDSYQELGLNIEKNGVYFPFFSNSRVDFNIDMLVLKNVAALSWRYMQALLEERLQAQEIFFNDVLNQQALISIRSIEDYQINLKKRVSRLLSQPQNALNRYHVISDTISGNFWLRLAQKGLAYPYWQSMADSVESYYSWGAADIVPSYEGADVAMMSILYPYEQQEIIVRLVLMLYDKSYIKKKSIIWADELDSLYFRELLANKELINSLPFQFNILKNNINKSLSS